MTMNDVSSAFLTGYLYAILWSSQLYNHIPHSYVRRVLSLHHWLITGNSTSDLKDPICDICVGYELVIFVMISTSLFYTSSSIKHSLLFFLSFIDKRLYRLRGKLNDAYNSV